MATLAPEQRFSVRCRRVKPIAFLVVLVLVCLFTGSCGQVVQPTLRSEAVGPIDSIATEAAAPEPVALSPEELAELAAVTSGAAAAAESAEQARLLQGRAATDPRAQGTIVAHATAPQVIAYERPDTNAPVVSTFVNPTERGGPLVFTGTDRTADGWLEVLLPIRPNGSTGWIRVDDVDLSVNPYRIEIDASAYELVIYRYGREELSTTIAIGNGDTPTPIGEFFLIELLRPTNPNGVYGPFAYGLSGYSETLDSFNGGEGIIGIHGTNQPELLGQDVSHGCIRVANPTISEMTQFLPLGTPVAIFRTAVDSDADEADSENQSL